MEIYQTHDNSNTIYSKKFNEHYHSIEGAVTESRHIYINLGLKNFTGKSIKILEIGYGTGLNAILTYSENQILKNQIYYLGIDIEPIRIEDFRKLAYNKFVDINDKMKFENLFCNNWNKLVHATDNFSLHKQIVSLKTFESIEKFDIIYFDAFSPDNQPEMWSISVFKKLAGMMKTGGILVSYCSKGLFKSNLRASGFEVKRHPGPGKKRHVVKAVKN